MPWLQMAVGRFPYESVSINLSPKEKVFFYLYIYQSGLTYIIIVDEQILLSMINENI